MISAIFREYLVPSCSHHSLRINASFLKVELRFDFIASRRGKRREECPGHSSAISQSRALSALSIKPPPLH